ncbi:hypothetical protein [Rathayibacter soli]|uniref:hypothetical protein n=1 Tax=Rathayibacter soli TaxID=3144168 RepID=UPI0027E4A7C1|nr:hypothetical protein [Glaciibacter superstes]
MSNILRCTSLTRWGSIKWATKEVKFAERPILATIQLSSFVAQDGDRFSPFQSRYAYAYLETANTPKVTRWGVPYPDQLADNHAQLTTDHVRFQLQVDNVTASAVAVIHDLSTTPLKVDIDVKKKLNFAIYDHTGTVLGTHQVVQLSGGSELDADEIQDHILARAKSQSEQSLEIIPVNPVDIPPEGTFRIDPRTRRPVQLSDQTTRHNAIHQHRLVDSQVDQPATGGRAH